MELMEAKVFAWFNAAEAKKFGTELAQLVIKELPKGERVAEKKLETRKQQLLKKIQTRADAFKREHRLNLYKTAQLGNAFKWELKQAGYSTEFVDSFTGIVLTAVR